MRIPSFLFSYLTNQLSTIRRQIKALNIPYSVYLVIRIHKDKMDIVELGGENLVYHKNISRERNIKNMIISWFEKQSLNHNKKFVACEIIGEKWLHPIISDLWLKEDIVPYFVLINQENGLSQVKKEYVREIAQRFFTNNIVKVRTLDLNEVEIAELVTLNDYHAVSDKTEFKLLIDLAEKLRGKKIVFINSTPQGGGIALMRHALIRVLKLLGVNVHWHVLQPSKEAFDITKSKFHNILQAVADEDTVLTNDDKEIYNAWISQNAQFLKNAYKDADVVVIDDPQPSGLIKYIKNENPKCKIIYRSHIQLVADLADKHGTAQNITWNFIWNNIKEMDLFVSHPIKEFIPKIVPKEKTVLMPATTDALDGLNKPLTPRQTDYYLKLFDKILLENNQKPLDKKRPYIIQIARFDPSKGIPDVIESYSILREKLIDSDSAIPQLIICGHGSIDDPDALPIYNLVVSLLYNDKYKHLTDDIKVVRLPGIDQILNVLLRESKIALQLSHKEGFEVKVSEALIKGIPVVAYRAGGIPLQVIDGVNGFLVEVGDTKRVAEKLHEFFTNDELYHKMRKSAVLSVNPQTTTVSNAINWLFLAYELISKGTLKGNVKNVKELIK